MKQRINEEVKVDIGLVSQALNNTNATGKYHPIKEYRQVLAVLNGGAMAATKTTKIELLQAKDADGTDAKGIPTDAGQEATAEITANTLITEGTIDLTSVANTDIVTVNGISFTKAAATDATKREFADAAGLVTCINHATYGVPGVSASYSGNVVTVFSTEPGEVVITLEKTEVAGTITLATTKAQAFVEINSGKIDKKNGFNHVAVKVTTTANSNVAVVMLRGNARFTPEQKVGAKAVV
ncbi:MAG: hypothetical protein AMS17_18680 [Spirochaetes bacterium DG_61]|jgi:hypothetical protein|nr:MAG: hypothetical protein AMS17_18680 [Spirochaetes bacterium DG_61]